MSKISWSRDPTEKRHVHNFTFTLSLTFTFIRHHGKTHNHRPRGDTTWRAQTDTQKTTSKATDTKGAGVSEAAKGKGERRGAELIFTDPARVCDRRAGH